MFTVDDVCSEISSKSKKGVSTTDIKGVIKQLGLLTTLDISGYNITDQGAHMVATLLLTTVSLEKLNLSSCTLTVPKAEKICNALKSLLSLKILELNDNDIGDEAADSIAVVILNNLLLEQLNISHNMMSSPGVLQITNALLKSKNIKILDISRNFITSNGIEKLSETLSEYPVLQELNLSRNLLTLDSVLRITQCLRHHPTLQALDLSNNSISFSSACEFIVDVILSVNQGLVNLNVSGRNIRPRFVEDYLSQPPNSEKIGNKFTLQNLYLLQHASLNTAYIQTKFIKAQIELCPISGEDITSYYVDHIGGVFYNQYHNFAIIIPPGAVSQGECVEIQATASHCGPYEIPDGFYPISSYFWISADYTFKIPVYIIMSHYVKIRSLEDMDHLYVLQTNACDSVTNGKKLVMNAVSDGVYFDYMIGYCVLATHHFCSYCQAKDEKHIPEYLVASYYTYDDKASSESYISEVCFCPSNSECKKVSKQIIYKNNYKNNIKSKEIR